MRTQVNSKSFDKPDETRPTGSQGHVDIVHLGAITATRATFPPGWRWSVNVKPVVGTKLCHTRHIGCVISGRLRVRLFNGTERELGPGDVYDVPSGHDAWVVGDQPFVSVDGDIGGKAA